MVERKDFSFKLGMVSIIFDSPLLESGFEVIEVANCYDRIIIRRYCRREVKVRVFGCSRRSVCNSCKGLAPLRE